MIYNILVKVTLLLSFVILMLVPSTLGLSFGKSDEMLIIPKSTKPAQIDGMWSTKTEWTDASETKFLEKGLTAYFRAKYDERFVYILIDFVSDQSLERSGDWAVVCFDTKSDDSNTPLADDYCFYRATRAGDFRSGIMQGNGTGWTIIEEAEVIGEFKARMRYSHLNDPYENKNDHVSYEFKIPIASYGLDEQMKIYVYVNDGYHNNFVEWPTNAGGKQFAYSSPTIKDVLAAPNNWDNLRLKSYTSEVGMQDERPKPPIDVTTDKTDYYTGEVVKIEGRVPALTDGHEVNIIVKDANGETFTKLRIKPADNKFAVSFQIPPYDKLFPTGRWTINVGYALWAAKVDINVLAAEKIVMNSVTISKPEVVAHTPLRDLKVGDEIFIVTEVKNNTPVEISLVHLLLIKDDLDFTASFQWVEGILPPNEKRQASVLWIPEQSGEYQAEVFFWSDLNKPTPLSESRKSVQLLVIP